MPLPGYQAIPVGMPTTRTYADLAAFAPDVMHIGGPVALGAWGLSAARRLGVPSVALYQTDFPRFARHYKVGAAEGLAWRWLRRIHSMAEVTLAPSSAAAWDLRRNGVPRVRLWGRGVDADLFHPCRRDEVLRAVATAIAETARREDLVVRFGGDEFVVVAADTDATSASILAERVRIAVSDVRVPIDDEGSPTVGVTASVGTRTTGPDLTVEDLVAAADRAMYAVKQDRAASDSIT